MKKFVNIFLTVCLALSAVSCTIDDTPPPILSEVPTPTQTQGTSADIQPAGTDAENIDNSETAKPSFEGKIAIISNSLAGSNEEYDSAHVVVKKYGEDKVKHITWPDLFLLEQENMINIVTELGADPEIKSIIVNQSVPGTNAAFEKLKEIRNDIFVIYIEPNEEPLDSSQRANIVLGIDMLGMGPAMVRQAQKLGAKTFVHYSFPRHMERQILSTRRNLIKEECEKIGIEFLMDTTVPDPMGITGAQGAQQFILDDVPKKVEKYGKDTAFFATLCLLQPPLIKSVVETGAIYPQPCCPSPYHGIVVGLGLEWDIMADENTVLPIKDIIALERAAIAEKDMLGRISTWPDISSMLFTNTAAEYAIKWINGEVPKEGIDVEVLEQLMEDYAGVEVYLTPYTDEYLYTENGTGGTYDNFLLMRMDYITFE